MKYAQYTFPAAIGMLLLLLAEWPAPLSAQRFNHATFSRSAPAVSRPAPVMSRSAPVTRSQPARVESAPVNRTINGGSRNIGNHNMPVNRNVTVNEHVTVNPRTDMRDHVNVYHGEAFHGARPYAYHPYHPYYWGPRWHPIGFFLSALAATAIRLSVGNQWYYYDDGCFYSPSGGGYTAVMPPMGAIVGYLPDGYETCQVGDTYYYYYAGIFFMQVPQGYQVVPAPIGAIISQLPDGAVEQNFNGETVLFFNNTYYEPISQDGQDAYQVVSPNSN